MNVYMQILWIETLVKIKAGVVTLYLAAAIRGDLFGVVEDILITFNPFLIIYEGAACSYFWCVLILYKVSSSIIIIDMDIFLVVLQRIGK